ncbi:MAG: dUTP diphosphatase [Bacilli bacterium]|nr:dUTP diphosphatase [Bacilli bacterium]
MNKFNELYEANKKLDKMFYDLYDNNREIFEKNVLELLVELGELANETRCFKYWSNKGPSDKNIILDEFADCMIMVLYFCNILDIDLNEDFDEPEDKGVVELFIYLYHESSLLLEDFTKSRIKKVLVNLVKLGNDLGFNDTDIITGGLLKIERNKLRMETGF